MFPFAQLQIKVSKNIQSAQEIPTIIIHMNYMYRKRHVGKQLHDFRLARRSMMFPYKTTQCCKVSVRTNSSKAVGAVRAVTQTALTLELVQQLGSGCRAFAFPLRFAPQVLCVAAHQVPSNTRRHSLSR